jgi:hypothetical protein
MSRARKLAARGAPAEDGPDAQAMLDAGTAFRPGDPERPPLGAIEGGKNFR